MPSYEFECKKCKTNYEEICKYDESGKYSQVKCPKCGSKSKNKVMSSCSFQFSNPVGTDRWNSDTMGHDYRFKYNIPNVKKEREMAENLSHMGSAPYNDIVDTDGLDVGIHDNEDPIKLM